MDRIAQLQFGSFSVDAQRATIRRLALRGLEDVEIAHLTGWTPEQVRSVLEPPLSADFSALIAARNRRSGSPGGPLHI
jgi:hypothetical protein